MLYESKLVPACNLGEYLTDMQNSGRKLIAILPSKELTPEGGSGECAWVVTMEEEWGA